MKKLSQMEIAQAIKNLGLWNLDGNAIKRDWQFKDFQEAILFINKVAEVAEQHNHHPEIYNVYNRVTLRFSTHDAGGLTIRDFNVAEDINNIGL